MKIREIRSYSGPNIYGQDKVFRFTLDFNDSAESGALALPADLHDRLIEILPGLRSSIAPETLAAGTETGKAQALTRVLACAAIEIQNLCGADLEFIRTSTANEPGIHQAIFAYEDEKAGAAAGRLASELIQQLLIPADSGSAPALADLKQVVGRGVNRIHGMARKRRMGATTLALVQAARDRGIPVQTIPGFKSYARLGYGRRQKPLLETITVDTSSYASHVSNNKIMTSVLLGTIGVRSPQFRAVESEQQAAQASRDFNGMMVVKPASGMKGRGITICKPGEAAARNAYRLAAEHGETVIMEEYIEGFDHRMLVVDYKLVATSQRIPGHVVGDGKHNICELIDRIELVESRNTVQGGVIVRPELDHQATQLLEENGMGPASVPAKDEIVYLRRTANVSTGGIAVDATNRVHPDNRRLAERAARMLHLNVAGIDFLSKDISRSWREIGGAICEVNASPGLMGTHVKAKGNRADVAGAVIDSMFPQGTPCRIPIVVIANASPGPQLSGALAPLLERDGYTTGLANGEGVRIKDDEIPLKRTDPHSASRLLLQDPEVGAALVEMSWNEILDYGFAFDRCDIAVLSELPEPDKDDAALRENMDKAVRLLIDTCGSTIIVNADDEHCLQAAQGIPRDRLWLVSASEENEAVRKHTQEGGASVVDGSDPDSALLNIPGNGAGPERLALAEASTADQETGSRLLVTAIHAAVNTIPDQAHAAGEA